MKFTTVSPQIKSAFEAKMEEVLVICRQKSGKDIPTIPMKFSQLGQRAGICRCVWTSHYFPSVSTVIPSSSYIVINPDYLKNHWDNMLNDTCPHEVAHYVAGFLYGKAGYNHGHLWKRVMAWMGIPSAERCHEYSLEGVKVRNTHRDYKYSCPNCARVFMLTPKKHQRHQFLISYGTRGLWCPRCKQNIVFEGFSHNGNFIPTAKKMEPKHVEVSPTVFVHTVNPPTPATPPPVVSEPTYRTITKFVNGMLVNERVQEAAAAVTVNA
jgi:predicted SprT family Zn-dependent metalloprotease